MSARLRRSLLGGAFVLPFWVALGLWVVPAGDRVMWFAVWTPLAYAVSVLSDHLWHRPSRLRRLEEERSRPRYGE